MGCYNCGRDPFYGPGYRRENREFYGPPRPFPYERRRGFYERPEYRRRPPGNAFFIGFPGPFR